MNLTSISFKPFQEKIRIFALPIQHHSFSAAKKAITNAKGIKSNHETYAYANG